MFGRNKDKMKVTVHINKDGDIWVMKPDGVSVSVCDFRGDTIKGCGDVNGGSIPGCDNHGPDFYNNFYPTAEQAREIESEIDWNKVNNKVRSILRDVERQAVNGRSGENRYPFDVLLLNPAEGKEVLKKFKSLGYGIVQIRDIYRITW